jgi:DNA-binding SARP family transcriptional activator
LRRTFGRAGRLHLSDEGYQLLTDGEAWIDTEQFVRHADAGAAAQREGRLADVIAHDEQALALYHRDLLEEGEWECSLAADAQDLRTRLGEVVDRLGAAYEQRGDWHRCLRASLRQLQLDDCNEVAHRRLMRAHTALGQLQLAERQYLRCVARLREQFGVGPSAETTAAYRSVAMRQSA